jgi:uncharacterized membrane protein YbhN (UPF0104 family)
MVSHIQRIVAHPAVKVGYFVLLVAATAFYLVRLGDRLPELIGRVQPVWVGAAFVLTCLSSLLYTYIQYDIYRQLGARASYPTVFRIVNISQLGKYLPGKVLFFGNFYLLSRQAGISNLQIGASFAISMAIWILTASLCSLSVLGLLEPVLRYSVLLLPFVLVLLIHPRFLGWLLKLVQRMAGRLRVSPTPDPAGASATLQDPLADLGVAFYLRVAFLYLATWVLAGLGAYLCLMAFVQAGLSIYPLALASIALGTVAGFLVLFAPVGLGVREGIGALILLPAVGADVALLSLVLLRGITVVVDLLLALVAAASARADVVRTKPGQ